MLQLGRQVCGPYDLIHTLEYSLLTEQGHHFSEAFVFHLRHWHCGFTVLEEELNFQLGFLISKHSHPE